MTLPLQWGWKIGCEHPECQNILEEWSEKGTPPLPSGDGQWYWASRQMRGVDGHKVYEQGRPKHIYYAYCPEHAVLGRRYENELGAWKSRRREAGWLLHQQFKGIPGILLKWTAQLLNHKIGQSMEDWELENPRPLPPWETP